MIDFKSLNYPLLIKKLGITAKKENSQMYFCFAHEDSEPSLFINHTNGSFFCHSCGVTLSTKGNFVQLVMSVKNISKRGAMQWIEENSKQTKIDNYFDDSFGSQNNIITEHKLAVRIISSNSKYRYIFVEESKLFPENATEKDLNEIQRLLNKKYRAETFDKLGLKINKRLYTSSRGYEYFLYGIIFPYDKNNILSYNPNNLDKVIWLEGKTDYITICDIGLYTEYCVKSYFNKTCRIQISRNDKINIFCLDKEDTPDNVLKRLVIDPDIDFVKVGFLNINYENYPGTKDISDIIFKYSVTKEKILEQIKETKLLEINPVEILIRKTKDYIKTIIIRDYNTMKLQSTSFYRDIMTILE